MFVMFLKQGKPRNIWSQWKSRTPLEKILIILCTINILVLTAVFYLNPTIKEQCDISTVHHTPDIYEESDSYVNTGQGKVSVIDFKF